MTNGEYGKLFTEQSNPATERIDELSTYEILRLINEQDALIAKAVAAELPQVEKAVDMLHEALSHGGRMFYVGAGTSGRLGVLDASECPPTYSTPPELVQGFIAGGDAALRTAVEGCEDDYEAGSRLIGQIGVTEKDVVVGITASGTAAYVIGACEMARAIGAKTIAVVNNTPTRLGSVCDITIAPIVGPEVVMGSTRMKSGTAQKMILNMLTTGTMIKLGKVYGNLMVDMKASNKKLYDRAVRIVCSATDATPQQAEKALAQADMQAKLAIMLLETGLSKEAAQALLAKYGGRLRKAVQAARQPQAQSM